tara:strand:- start:20344 stop:21015 length:672 start_codon:yes stop_codon:yes gene_type:complete
VELFQTAFNSMIRIYIIQEDENQEETYIPFGSGTYYEHNGLPMVISADHVLGSFTARTRTLAACHPYDWKYELMQQCVHITPGPISWTLDNRDVAISFLDGFLTEATSANIHLDYDWTIGEFIVIAHNGGGPAVSPGVISWGMDSRSVEYDGSAWPGSSGGGVFNGYGELIGVIHSVIVLPAPWSGPGGREIADGHKIFALLPANFITTLNEDNSYPGETCHE